ncbi:MAG: NAD(P)-dependent alcohol dehydrogenase [Candidatus Hodarchaeales archaeon]
MRAVICTKYGGPEVLKLKEVDKPVPKDNEVLIKNYFTTVHVGDVRMRKFDVPRLQWLLARMIIGIRKPKQVALGMEMSGVVEAVGKDVTLYKKGDPVMVGTFWEASSYAEYVCMPEDGALVIKPSNMTMEEAAAGATTGGTTALVILKKANIKPGQKVLVNGASGSIGTYAVQFCKVFGAEVTGVCSTSNLELVKSLGADKVIDYTKENFWEGSETYDVILDAVAKLEKSQAKKALKKTGIYLNSDKDSGSAKTDHIPPLIKEIKELIEAGSVKAVIDPNRFTLEQIVEAHRYVESGRKKGHVIVTVADEV